MQFRRAAKGTIFFSRMLDRTCPNPSCRTFSRPRARVCVRCNAHGARIFSDRIFVILFRRKSTPPTHRSASLLGFPIAPGGAVCGEHDAKYREHDASVDQADCHGTTCKIVQGTATTGRL
jgi:hypothetical protein